MREGLSPSHLVKVRSFSLILNVEHPRFFPRLERCAERNEKLKAIAEINAPNIVKFFRKLPLI